MTGVRRKSSARSIVLVAAIVAAATAARLPYLRQANLSPDAADYLNIARNIAEGRGFTHSIKWHFFTRDPVVHSAVGERPLLYPIVLAPLCRRHHPARAAQYLNVLIAAIAVILGAAWARRFGLGARGVAISAALLAFNPGLLMCSIYPWTEPLYLCWLFAVLIAVGRGGTSVRSAWAAALFTALAYLTRPSAVAIVAGLGVWYWRARRFRALAHYLGALVVFLAPWFALVWAVRGDSLYSLQNFHFSVLDITDGMAAGFGKSFPGPIGFLRSNAGAAMSKSVVQTIGYLEHLFGPAGLSVFSAFVFLRPFVERGEKGESEGPWVFLALFHFLLPAITWATFDAVRFMLPCFAVLLVPVVGGMDDLAGGLASRRFRIAAWCSALAVAAVFYGDLWAKLYSRVIAHRESDLAMQVARIEFDRIVGKNAVVAAFDPFSINYYFERPTIVLPEKGEPNSWAREVERFIALYRPDYIVLPRKDMPLATALARRGLVDFVSRVETVGLYVLKARAR